MDAIENLLEFGLDPARAQLPGAVATRTKMAILDTLASAVAGRTAEGVGPLSELIEEWQGAPQATVVSNGHKTTAPLAALANGVAARAWDLDDVHEQNTCHVTANIVPAALAIAEARPIVSGQEFLAANAVGMEVACRISGAPKLSFSETGAANSYQAGFFGSAITAARLMHLDLDTSRHAMGIAYARVCGNHQGYLDGAMTVRLMQGVAPEGGVVSALMAERGLTGSRKVLEGRFGYYETYQRNAYNRETIVARLGEDWHLMEISIKPVYPCCKYTHGPIDAALEAMKKVGGSPDAIERIDIKVTNREVHDLVCETRERKWNPETVVDCQFSLPFTVAYSLVHDGMSLKALEPEARENRQVRELMQRIHVTLDVEAQGKGRGTFPMPGNVSMTMRSGKRSDAEVVYVKGHPKNPMTYDDVAQKMRTCAEFAGLGRHKAEALIDAVHDIESLPNAATIAELAAVTA